MRYDKTHVYCTCTWSSWHTVNIYINWSSASGSVYKAEHKESGKLYALKKIKIDLKTVENTMKEIKFMGSVKHPNALEFLGFYIQKQDCCVCSFWLNCWILFFSFLIINMKCGVKFCLSWLFFSQGYQQHWLY
jgi:serine/threonine protein kinase